MKRIYKNLSLLLALVLTCGFLSYKFVYAATDSTRFIDVPQTHWAYASIENLAQKNIINGVDATHYAPEANVTRAEFLKLLVQTLQIPTGFYQGIFTDVPADKWYATYVEAGFAKGLVKGISATEFAPDENITREQLAVMIMNTYTYIKSESASSIAAGKTTPFADMNTVSAWAKDAVTASYVLGIVNGRTSDSFEPKGNATRAEAAKVISVMMDGLNWVLPTSEPTATPTLVPTATPVPTIEPTPHTSLRIASTLIQLSSDTRANILNDIDIMIKKAVDGSHPDMVVLSEILYQRRLTDVPSPSYAQGEIMPGQYTNFITQECQKYNIYIVFNLLEKLPDSTQKNAEVMMDRSGTIVGKYYKIHLPDSEQVYSIPGTDANVIDTEFGKIALNVCYDLDPAFNQDVAAEQAAQGAKLLIVSSVGEYWKGAQQAAADNGIYAVISGQQEYNFYGTGNKNDPISGIFGPDGSVLAGTDNPTTKGTYNNKGGGSYCYYDIPLSDLK